MFRKPNSSKCPVSHNSPSYSIAGVFSGTYDPYGVSEGFKNTLPPHTSLASQELTRVPPLSKINYPLHLIFITWYEATKLQVERQF